MYTVEPADHWKAGDRAYCLRGMRHKGRWVVEKGRVYTVAEAKLLRGCMMDALKLEGVDTGDTDGFSSTRFVCLRGDGLPIKQIAERTRGGWHEAYVATARLRGNWPA